MPVGSITFLSLLSPVVAVLGGWAVLHQSLGAGQIVGVAIVLTAVLVVTLHTTPGVGRGPKRRVGPHRSRAETVSDHRIAVTCQP